MSKTLFNPIFVLILVLFGEKLAAQQVQAELGPDQIGLNQNFTIKISIANEKIKSYDQFPDIPSFEKQGISQSSSMNVINGQVTSSNSLIQYYKPSQKGSFTLQDFSMTINGSEYEFQGKTITVVDPISTRQGGNSSGGSIFDLFVDPFGRSEEAPEYVEMEDEAFFSVSVDKEEIYEREGFTLSMAFYMSENNKALFNFYKPREQLDDALKKVKPSNAWEENYNITNIEPEQVSINGKRWTRYKVYEATFFPFSEGTIEIPSISWEMIKYLVAKNPSFYGANRQEDFKTFYSAPKTITVKPLPPHPLRNEVAVGQFQLRENITGLEVETGEGFTYNFGISGSGNINSINPPKTEPGGTLTTYDPNVRQQINRGYGRVSGIKEYSYYLTINEPGTVSLDKHFSWIFFDPAKASYDTLRPTAEIRVVGESKTNQAISNQRLGGIYDRINSESNTFSNKQFKRYFGIAINGLLIGILGVVLWVYIRRR